MELLTNIKEANPDNIVCFGAGDYGVEFAKVAKEYRLTIKYFCDNDAARWGTFLDGVEIQSLDYVLEKIDDPTFVLSNWRYEKEIKGQLEQAGIKVYYHSLFEDDFLRKGKIEPKHLVKYYQDFYQKHQKKDSDLLFSPFFSVVLTYRCSLNCKNCIGLIPYYKKPTEYKKEDIFKDIDRVSELFDFISVLNLLGGEPLTHPDVYEIIDYACQKENFKYVLITTNGTIPLDKEKLKKLNKEKTIFSFSNYEAMSTKLLESREILDEIGIMNIRVDMENWKKVTVNIKNKLTEEQRQKNFESCFSKNCPGVVGGEIGRCGQQKSMDLLEILPQNSSECVDIFDVTISEEELKQNIKNLIYGEKPIKPCDYCSFLTEPGGEQVPVAEQTKGKLPYKKYYE